MEGFLYRLHRVQRGACAKDPRQIVLQASCVSGFIQRAAVVALGCKQEMEEVRRLYQARRDLFVSRPNNIPGVRCESPAGAFYAWALFDFPGMDSNDVCAY